MRPKSVAALGQLAAFCALLSWASAQVDEECVATAIAATGQGEAAAEALSNAVAETLTDSIVCENGAMAQPAAVGGLSVAVALAISEANMIGQNCSADAEAAAEIASEVVTDRVAGELLDQVDGDEEVLATAWLTARGADVKAAVQNSPTFLGEDGCLNLDALANGLPTAVELGVILSDAVQQILQAVQCGNNLQESEEECLWADRMFIGKCIGTGDPAAPPSPRTNDSTDSVTCLTNFGKCRRGGGADCTNTLRECLAKARECTFC